MKLTYQQDALDRVLKSAEEADKAYQEYERLRNGEPSCSPLLADFVADIRKRAEEVAQDVKRANNLFIAPVLRANIICPESGKEMLVVISKPNRDCSEPHISKKTYECLQMLLCGKKFVTEAPFDIEVLDKTKFTKTIIDVIERRK